MDHCITRSCNYYYQGKNKANNTEVSIDCRKMLNLSERPKDARGVIKCLISSVEVFLVSQAFSGKLILVLVLPILLFHLFFSPLFHWQSKVLQPRAYWSTEYLGSRFINRELGSNSILKNNITLIDKWISKQLPK